MRAHLRLRICRYISRPIIFHLSIFHNRTHCHRVSRHISAIKNRKRNVKKEETMPPNGPSTRDERRNQNVKYYRWLYIFYVHDLVNNARNRSDCGAEWASVHHDKHDIAMLSCCITFAFVLRWRCFNFPLTEKLIEFIFTLCAAHPSIQ